jgi:hypothetical protein
LNNSSTGTCDILLAKYDDLGNVTWAKRAGGTDSEAGNGVAISSSDNVFITGYFTSNNIAFGSSVLNNFMVGYRDLFVASYDGSGTPLWGVTAGESYDETSNSISVNAAGTEVHIGGVFNSAVVSFGSYNVSKGCGDDVFIAKLLGPSVGVKENYLTNELIVYPNPTSGKFRVKGDGEIIFFNLLGEEILNRKLNSDDSSELNEFDFTEEPKGVYFYRILSERRVAGEGRVIVQ